MDPVSQGVVGALFAQCGSGRVHRRSLSVVGALSAMSADLDVLIRSSSDPLLNIEYHRHFSHSLLFVPLGATLVALLLWPLLRRRLAFGPVWRASLIGYATAGLLDACTSYGTHLMWPFSDHRTAWSCISIVDPVFTLGTGAGVVVAFWRRRRLAPWLTLLFALGYLGLGVFQRERAESTLWAEARARGHSPSRLAVKPTLGNLVLWRGLYRAGDTWHVDAVRVGLSRPRLVPGESAPALDTCPPGLPADSLAGRDLERFRRFSGGAIASLPGQPWRITDLRYSRLPHRLAPLWAIDIDPTRPDLHARFQTFRGLDEDERRTFLELLLGTSALQDPPD